MAATRDSIADIWGPRTPQSGSQWPVRVDQNVDEDPDRWVQASCFLCSNGCGIDIAVRDDRPGGRIVGVRGREVDVVNRGRLGPKGLYGWVANASPDRLTRPLVRRGDRLERASWDDAMDLVVRRMKDTKETYTAGAIGFYSSGQLFAEENYTLSVIGKAGSVARATPASGFGLLRDLQDLWLMVNESAISAAVLLQGARALGDRDLEKDIQRVEKRNGRQRSWLLTRIRQAAPQTLTVPS